MAVEGLTRIALRVSCCTVDLIAPHQSSNDPTSTAWIFVNEERKRSLSIDRNQEAVARGGATIDNRGVSLSNDRTYYSSPTSADHKVLVNSSQGFSIEERAT